MSGHRLHFRPKDGWVGDAIPFFWDGEYHIFYLKRNLRGGTPWSHIVSTDLVTWAELPDALPLGKPDEPDGGDCWTGSVIERDGAFHIFYTGHNNNCDPPQTICHATSPDLIHWTKDPANPIMQAEERWYERQDWRDPYVFWNEEEQLYWMTITAREKHGAMPRRGTLALATSPDLVEWTIKKPYWTPWKIQTPECSDIFQAGGRWYLIYSSFDTRYRHAATLNGPWAAPADDMFDQPHMYAAKRLFDGRRHLLFGWVASREGETDGGGWEWGGHLSLPRELVPQESGSLHVKAPEEIVAAFDQVGLPEEELPRPLRIAGQWRIRGRVITGTEVEGRALCAYDVPADYLLSCTVTLHEPSALAGFLLRTDEDCSRGYLVVLDQGQQRLAVHRYEPAADLPAEFTRPVELRPHRKYKVHLFVQGSILEVFVNDEVCLATRMYDWREGRLGLVVDNGQACFSGILVGQASSLSAFGDSGALVGQASSLSPSGDSGSSLGPAPSRARSGRVTHFRITRRHLPHWEQPGATYFITFRLKDASSVDLTRPDIAPIIAGAVRHFAGVRYQLHDYTVMPDHVHLIIQPEVDDRGAESLGRIVHSLKSWTANQINRRVRRSGALWLDERHDRIVRDEHEYTQTARYIWMNPAAKGLVADPQDWPWWGHGQREE